MTRVFDGRFAVDQGTETLFSDFESGGPMWTGEGQRETRVAVRFAGAFRAPPIVHLSMSLVDLDHARNPRWDLLAQEITAEGFAILFRTWGDTRIARARADWLALGEVQDDDDWKIL